MHTRTLCIYLEGLKKYPPAPGQMARAVFAFLGDIEGGRNCHQAGYGFFPIKDRPVTSAKERGLHVSQYGVCARCVEAEGHH